MVRKPSQRIEIFPVGSRYRYLPCSEAEFVDLRDNGKQLVVCFNTSKK